MTLEFLFLRNYIIHHILLNDIFFIDFLSYQSTRIATIHDFFLNEKKRLKDPSIETMLPGDTLFETQTYQSTVNERSAYSLEMYKSLIRNNNNFASLLLKKLPSILKLINRNIR